jgi:hypothetical protein
VTQDKDGRFARHAAYLAVKKLVCHEVADDHNLPPGKPLDD